MARLSWRLYRDELKEVPHSALLSANLRGVLCTQDPHMVSSPHRGVFNRAKTAVAGVTAAGCQEVAEFDGNDFCL